MRTLLEACPACHGELIVTQQTCVACGTMVVGQFTPNIFSKLSPENLAFLEIFVKNKGNVKEMERELGVSYWTIRGRINDIIDILGFENKAVDVPEADLADRRQDILARLDQGEIGAQEAADLLNQLKRSAT